MGPRARVALGLCLGFLVVESGFCRTVCTPSGFWDPELLATISHDGRFLTTISYEPDVGYRPLSYRMGQCVWKVDSMKNGTFNGGTCHTIGSFIASSTDGSTILFSPQRGISCLVKTGDYMGPEPTRSAKCVTRDETRASLSADGQVISSLYLNEQSNYYSIKYIKERDIVPLSGTGWKDATPSTAIDAIPAGVRISSSLTTRWMSEAGLIAFTLTLKEGDAFRRAVSIVDTSTGSYHNLSMDWINPTYWGYAAHKQEQYLFYFESQPGTVRNLCATTRAVAKVCKEIHTTENMTGLVLLGGYTARDDSQPVALVSYQEGLSLTLCKIELSGAGQEPGHLTCLTNLKMGFFEYSVVIPESDTGVWMWMNGYNDFIVDLSNLKEGPIKMQTTKQLPPTVTALSTGSFAAVFNQERQICVATY